MSIDTTTAEQQLALALDTKEREEKTLVEDITLSRTEIRTLLLKSDRTNLESWPGDHRQYKFIRLPNGLKVLLVENNKTSQAEAVLSVNVGSSDEPNEFPGLAHFLEHMVFQGCEKYPNNKYQEFITSRGGFYNAHTDDENTQFSFSIGHQHFEKVLDILAGFIINPLLNPEYAEQEVNAVHMEFTQHVEQDILRAQYVGKCFVNPEHPDHRFSFGNLDTLSNIEKVLPALRAFHQQHYKADKMTLVLKSNHRLQDLECFAARYFSPLAKSIQQIPKTLRKPRFLPGALGITVHIESIQKNNVFLLQFIIFEKGTIELEQAMAYILFLLNDSSEDGLFDVLKGKGWIRDSGGAAGVVYPDDRLVEFSLNYPLTEAGKTKIDEITVTTLEYIQFIRSHGIDKRFFKEIQETNIRALKFRADQLNARAENFVSNLEQYPLKNFFVGSTILRDTAFPRKLIRKVLDHLTFQNSRQFVLLDPSSSGEDNEDNTPNGVDSKGNDEKKHTAFCQNVLVEPYTGARYTVHASDPLKASEKQNNVFKFPPSSSFLPTDFKIKATSQKFQYPKLIWNTKRLRIFLSQDLRFEKPFAETRLIFVSGLARNTTKNAALWMIFNELFSVMIQKKLGRNFELAEVDTAFSAISRGLQLSITGFSDKHEKAVLEIIEVMASSTIDLDHFCEIKKTYIDSIAKQKTQSPVGRCRFYLNVLLNRFEYSAEQLLSAFEEINLKTFQEYIEMFRKSFRLEMYGHGNRTPKQTRQLGEDIVTKFMITPESVVEPQNQIAHFPPGSSGHYLIQTDLTSNAVVLFLQASDNALKTKQLLSLLSKIMEHKFFHQLRTTEQLAYSLQCGLEEYEMTFGLAFNVESTEYSSKYLLGRIEDFIVKFEKELSEMTEEAFIDYRDALGKDLIDSINNPASLFAYSSPFLREFNEGTYSFRQIFRSVEAFKKLTLSMLQAFYKELIGDKIKRALIIRTDDKNKNIVQKSKSVLMSYPNDYKPLLEQEIHRVKSVTPLFADYMKKGEERFQSFLEYNRTGFIDGSLEAGDEVDVDEEDIAAALHTHLVRQETVVAVNDVVNSFAQTLLARQEPPINTVLAYCFGQYRSASQTDLSATKVVVEQNAKATLAL